MPIWDFRRSAARWLVWSVSSCFWRGTSPRTRRNQLLPRQAKLRHSEGRAESENATLVTTIPFTNPLTGALFICILWWVSETNLILIINYYYLIVTSTKTISQNVTQRTKRVLSSDSIWCWYIVPICTEKSVCRRKGPVANGSVTNQLLAITTDWIARLVIESK